MEDNWKEFTGVGHLGELPEMGATDWWTDEQWIEHYRKVEELKANGTYGKRVEIKIRYQDNDFDVFKTPEIGGFSSQPFSDFALLIPLGKFKDGVDHKIPAPIYFTKAAADARRTKIIHFLQTNGFQEIEEGSFANTYCNVVIENNGKIHIANNQGDQHFIEQENNLFELIGVLLYHGFIPKDFITVK
jgi:hypothetical protein